MSNSARVGHAKPGHTRPESSGTNDLLGAIRIRKVFELRHDKLMFG
jgi:hypothetical protein